MRTLRTLRTLRTPRTLESVRQMGLDGHRTFSLVVGRDAAGKIVSRQRLEHRDRLELHRRLRQYPAGTPVVLEASFGWGWLADELQAAGLEVHLANGLKVAGWRKTRGIAKSNRTDGELLSELPGEKENWWEVWLAPPEVRDQREWLRHRMGLVQIQTMLKNRIHATLHRHGIVQPHSDLFGVAGRRFLSLLVADKQDQQDPRLHDSGRQTLKDLLILLDQVRRLIARATWQIRKIVQGHPAARRLLTLPGIGWILAYTIVAEIGRIERFERARNLACYSLLTPIADDSGEEDGDTPIGRHVGHAGRRTLKWAFIEAAHGAVRSDARCRAIFDRRTDCGKRDKNRGYITVAHELCRLSHLLWSKDVDYDPAGTIRPGSPSSPEDPSRGSRPGETRGSSQGQVLGTRDSCPGMGQPDAPMVPARSERR